MTSQPSPAPASFRSSFIVACGAKSHVLLQRRPEPIPVKYRFRVYNSQGDVTMAGGKGWHRGSLVYCAVHRMYYLEVKDTRPEVQWDDPYPELLNEEQFKIKIVPEETDFVKAFSQKFKATLNLMIGVPWVAIRNWAGNAAGEGFIEVSGESVKAGEKVYIQTVLAANVEKCQLKCSRCAHNQATLHEILGIR
ncbi:hypothetical protein NMY22_g9477 [Coprinellus aureogranulatus]|nr:hypothetical protein NMY22_g9477 [Coprinellus aureogranulatus]